MAALAEPLIRTLAPRDPIYRFRDAIEKRRRDVADELDTVNDGDAFAFGRLAGRYQGMGEALAAFDEAVGGSEDADGSL